jgi:uridine kinase
VTSPGSKRDESRGLVGTTCDVSHEGGLLMNPPRADMINQLAALVCDPVLDHPTRVAVDGITASGKTTLAGELVAELDDLGRPAIHLSMDGYHHPRAHRYRRGRRSAVGYYDDAYDFGSFVAKVLVPLGAGGDRRYRARIIDLGSDRPVDEAPVLAPVEAVVVVDGSFLQRPELVDHWDQRIFFDTDVEVAEARGVTRDAVLLGGESAARAAYRDRYHAAAQLYLDAVHPADRATVIVDNNDPAHPRLRIPGPAG